MSGATIGLKSVLSIVFAGVIYGVIMLSDGSKENGLFTLKHVPGTYAGFTQASIAGVSGQYGKLADVACKTESKMCPFYTGARFFEENYLFCLIGYVIADILLGVVAALTKNGIAKAISELPTLLAAGFLAYQIKTIHGLVSNVATVLTPLVTGWTVYAIIGAVIVKLIADSIAYATTGKAAKQQPLIPMHGYGY